MRRRITAILFSLQIQVFVLAMVGILIRVGLYRISDFVAVTPDSISYTWVANDTVHNRPVLPAIVNTVRPPMYPLVLSFFMAPHPYANATDITTYLVSRIVTPMVLLQTVFGIIAGLLLFWAARQIIHPRIAFLLSFFYLTNLLVIPWERYLLTESFAMDLTIVLLSLFILYVKRQNPVTILCITITLLIFAFLRSTAMVLIPITFFGILLSGKKQALIPLGFSVLLCVVMIFGYIRLNGVFHKYPTFQFSSTVNIFGRMGMRNYPIPNRPNDDVAWLLGEFGKANLQKHPFSVLGSLDPFFYSDGPFMAKVDAFNKASLILNWRRYLLDSSTDFINLWKEVSSWIILPPINPQWDTPNSLRTRFVTAQIGFVYAYQLAVLLFYLSPLFFISFWLAKKKNAFLFGMVSLMIFSQFASAVIFGFEEFARLVSNTVPLLFFNIAIILDALLFVRQKRMVKR